MSIKAGNVSAGILENATYPDGTSVPLVGLWMEFGTTASGGEGNSFHVPPRPFLRNTAREYRVQWNKIFLDGMRRRVPSEITLKKIGALMAGQIKKTISNFTDPPNAPSTIRAKGKDSPLRDESILLNSISWEYEDAVRRRGVEHKRIG